MRGSYGRKWVRIDVDVDVSRKVSGEKESVFLGMDSRNREDIVVTAC